MITPALISGTVVGRLRMRAWILFVLIWGTVLYDPVAHWVWGAWEEDGKMKYGWMRELGVLDFAGTRPPVPPIYPIHFFWCIGKVLCFYETLLY